MRSYNLSARSIRGLVCGILSFLALRATVQAQANPQLIAPGMSLVLKGWKLSQASSFCQLAACPKSPLGGEPVNTTDRCLSLFLPFSDIQLRHKADSFFFRPGDWSLRLEAPNLANSPFPVVLTLFREDQVEQGTGVIGDEPGEGVGVCFLVEPEVWSLAQQVSLDLTITNLTQGSARERSYLLGGVGRGGLPGFRLCASGGDPGIDVIVQREATGITPELFAGATGEISVPVPAGTVGRATLYVALVSNLPAGSTGLQAWWLSASVTGDLKVVGVTTAGTAAAGVAQQFSRPAKPELIHPDTGRPQGEGFAATALPALDEPPAPLPRVGTATVLAVTVETVGPVASGSSAAGEIIWRDNMVGVDPATGAMNVPLPTHFTVNGWTYYPCTCRGAKVVFHSQAGELTVAPGEDLRIARVLASEVEPLCQLIQCPAPRLGEEDPNATPEPGFSFFVSFSQAQQLTHKLGVPFFREGDWELLLRLLRDPIFPKPDFPALLEDFREEHIDHGQNGILGDQAGEGVNLFFPVPPRIWETAQKLELELVLSNRTAGTPRERTYLVRGPGRGGLPPIRLCERRVGTGSGFALRSFPVLTQLEHPPWFPELASGDLDADGDLDLLGRLYLFGGAHELVSLVSSGGGRFTVSRQVETCGDCYYAFAGGDLDGDADLDLALGRTVEDPSSLPVGDLVLHMNRGGGAFGAATFIPMPPPFVPGDIALADLNGDGNTDVAASNQYSIYGNELAVLLGDGRGGFAPPRITALDQPTETSFLTSIAATDLDGDGDLDLAGLNPHEPAQSVAILLGDGRGGLAAARFADSTIAHVDRVSPGEDLLAQDLDGDGDTDLALGLRGHMSVLLNRGDASFAAPVVYPARRWVSHMAAADLDGDGDPELAASCSVDNTVVVLRNDGRGTFVPGGALGVGELPWGLAAGDLDGDRDVDLATADGESFTVSILENLRLGASREGDPRLDVIVQAAPAGPGGLSPALYDGETGELTVLVRGGEVGTATFYVALVSGLPADGPGIQAWSLLASIEGDLEVSSVTTSGTAAAAADIQIATPAELLDPLTGAALGGGFASLAYLDLDGAAALPPAGTATVLKVTVRTRDALLAGQEVRGRIAWHDAAELRYPDGTTSGEPKENWAQVLTRIHFFCECRGLRLVFRSPGIIDTTVGPGQILEVPEITPGALPPTCETIDCPPPLLGGVPLPLEERGISLFLPFPPPVLYDSWRVRLFRPGDWLLELLDPADPKRPPLVLADFREEHVELGSSVLGDQPGEGVNLFFPFDPDLWAEVAQRTWTVRVHNRMGGDPSELPYRIGRLGSGGLPAFRLCPTEDADSRVDVIVQDRFAGSSPELFAGAASEVSFLASGGSSGAGTFHFGIVSDFPEPVPGLQGWSLAASVSGDLRVAGGRTVGAAGVARSLGFEVFQIVDPAVIHPDTGLPQGEGFIQAIVLAFRVPLTLPPVGTETVGEVTVETSRPVPAGEVVSGRVDWRDGMRGRGQPVRSAMTVLGSTIYPCTCRGADIHFRAPADCDLRCEPVARHYGAPSPSVDEAVLGPVRITEATNAVGQPVPFGLEDCDGDGDIDLAIRSSSAEAIEPATVHLDAACPAGQPPGLVRLRLITDNAVITAYDGSGRAVGSAAATRPYREQLLVLEAPEGIARVEIRAEQSCLVEVCWCCGSELPPGGFRRGDSNGDAKVDLSDAVNTLGFLFLGFAAPSCPDAADANDDGSVDLSDPVSTLNFLFLGGAEPPAPGPFACGADPTPGQLGACGAAACP